MSLTGYKMQHSRGLLFFIAILLVWGVFFRFANLDYKVYWHDEAYTSLRAAGFTRQEIDREIFTNRIIPAQELQKFQRIKPGSTAADTIHSLALEDPQHPPLYFLMARFWMQTFGSSLTASRMLPALLSLLALPFMYGLAVELFGSRLVAIVATALLALSPFDILFAQTARQYSLLTALVIGNSFLLLRALRLLTWPNWLLYSLGSAIAFYTHPMYALTVVAHGAYVLLLSLPLIPIGFERDTYSLIAPPLARGDGGVPNAIEEKPIGISSPKLQLLDWKVWWKHSHQFWKYLLAVAGALLLYSPWLIVIKSNYQRFSATTDWTRASVDLLYLVKLWILNVTCPFLDLDFGFDNVWTYLLRLLVIATIALAIYVVCRQTPRTTWLFILLTIFVPFLLLALPDLLEGGKRSTVSRYLISCFPGLQLAVAYLLANKIIVGQWLWRGVTVLLITGSIASCTVSAFSDTWWDKDLSYSNAEVARLINADAKRSNNLLSANLSRTSSTNFPTKSLEEKPRQTAPLVLSDIGDDFTNTGDLISLSYRLNQNVQLLLLNQPPNLELLHGYTETLVFRPSQRLFQAFKQQQIKLEKVSDPGRLWRIQIGTTNPDNSCGLVKQICKL
ncbi:MAG TPA: glycosyltransferase family 39 protein [Allocoleopsis sp.]